MKELEKIVFERIDKVYGGHVHIYVSSTFVSNNSKKA